MTMAEIRVKKWGNSIGIIIPNEIAKIEEISDGDIIKVDIMNNRRVDGFGMFKNSGMTPFKREKDRRDDIW